MEIKIVYKNNTQVLPVEPTITGFQFKHACAAVYSLNPNRIKIQFENKKYLNEQQSIEKQTESNKVIIKYIGPQISYRLVFLLEYIGPIIIACIFANSTQKTLWILHYIKRILETIFVHTFSNDTMPIRNVFKNCSYYYGFAYFVLSNEQKSNNTTFQAMFFISEILNFICHYHLRMIRNGTQGYQDPTNILFKFIACPNYTFELLSWLFFGLAFNNYRSYIFTCFGYYQIRTWGIKKQQRLNQLFPESYRYFAVFPFPCM